MKKKESPLPNRFMHLLHHFALRIVIEQTALKLNLPIRHDPPKDIKSESAKWIEFLSYFPKSHQYKVPTLLALTADEIREMSK